MPERPRPPGATGLVPLLFDARWLRVLVVGAGAVGLRRAGNLVGQGVAVTLVAPEARGDIPEGCHWIAETFEAGHLAGHNLAVAATDDAGVNAAVGQAAASRGIACCRADDVGTGSVVFPLDASAGPISAAVSAGVPALSRRLGAEVRALIEPAADFARAVSAVRSIVGATVADAAQRREIMADAASPEAQAVHAADGEDGLRLWLASRHACLRGELVERLGGDAGR